MRVGLVARWLSLESGGVKEYTELLIQHLLKIDQKNEYVIFYSTPRFIGRFPSAKEIAIPIPSKLLWDYAGLPFYVHREHIDLIWTPSYVIPFPVTCPSVATFHDMAYYFMPQAYSWSDVLYMRTAIPGSIERASALLAVSESTKQDMVQLFPDSEAKIHVTLEAAAPDYKRVTDRNILASVKAEYGLRQPFIFYSGSISPRKGLSFLLQAFAHLREEHDIPHSLVVTGGRRWGDATTNKLLERFPQEQLLVLGHVPRSVMPALYSLADVFVYPSLFEGFGLPVLEAMACGCPVVCSSLTSLPEVAGDAALLVDPRNLNALAQAIALALNDPQTRLSLVEKGHVRSALFTWEETARRTLEVFQMAGSAPGNVGALD